MKTKSNGTGKLPGNWKYPFLRPCHQCFVKHHFFRRFLRRNPAGRFAHARHCQFRFRRGPGGETQSRDAVLEAGEDLFNGTLTAEGAEQMLDSDIERLQNAAQTVLTENGFDYGVRVEIGKDYFNTRTYDGEVTLPAGEYEAVRVILGEGKGQNWWCVMFPPMCLPAAEADTEISDVLTKNEEDVVKSNPKYEARFKIVELFENFYRKIK